MDSILTSPELQQAIANILLLVTTGVVGALAKAAYSYLKSHTSVNQFMLLQEVADAAVKAAEQGAMSGFVTDKKATATKVVQDSLDKAGLKGVSSQQIEAAIEAAVLTNFNEGKTTAVEITEPLADAPIEAEDAADVAAPDPNEAQAEPLDLGQ